ncbi:MAG: acyl-CoA dehydratase activase [Clostridiales bacterium]|nr:acyl-CoA dehydratase activase [Clostridiales bacterium]
MNDISTKPLYLGLDIGSTTVKAVVINTEADSTLYSCYIRHRAKQSRTVRQVLEDIDKKFPQQTFRVAVCGSGGKAIATAIDASFIQEVVANAAALRARYDNVGTAIELGGQDAKIIFFRRDSQTDNLEVADMRMNGSCAGGTGAFIDEVASILNVPVDEFNALAAQGTTVYDVSGRCGVYAKTDIQPLLNQGISKADLALSTFHAIAKQTIGGLAQGLDITAPVAFEGGPLTFNPTLVKVFCERLELKEGEALQPDHPELIIARGAALSLDGLCADSREVTLPELVAKLLWYEGSEHAHASQSKPFFATEQERDDWKAAHALPAQTPIPLHKGQKVRAWLGIDSGSTTTKFVLLDDDENLLDSFYAPNAGEPLQVAKDALIALRNRYRDAGAELEILGVGTTGYGEQLFARAFSAECHAVETVAHARAAAKYVPDATFILDIGGQDMKAIWLDHGIITNIVVNEACSSGCGSFLENFASSLHIPVEQIAEEAFRSPQPACLGSRCTVFMNSSIITEQRSGKSPGDIMAGLCRSIIENVFTKVIRISNLDSLGDNIVVQGGTFRNDAVLRAMEEHIGRPVTRSPYPGVMGAIGAALIAKERSTGEHTFIGLDAMDDFTYTQEANAPCPFCGNHCKRAIVTFSNGASWVTNNRCERGEVLGDPKDESVRAQLREKNAQKAKVPNLYPLRQKLLFQDYPCPDLAPKRNITIGIPRVLSFWDSMPFWNAFLRSLGFTVQLSAPSTRKMYESGLSAVTSDTVCFPAKLVHGHIRDLVNKKVDRIFMPSITTVPSENTEKTSESMCAVVKGYPIVLRNADNPAAKWGIPYDAPLFHWYTAADRLDQLGSYMESTFQVPRELTKAAIQAGDEAQASFRRQLVEAGQKVLDEVREKGTYAVVLASRPYQNDALVNHDLPEMFTKLGIPVLTADSLPHANEVELHKSALDVVNNYHARMLSSAIMAASDPNLEYVQLVSFGCGHDAYLSDEIIRLMREISGKTPLVLKVDESDIQGPLNIRVRSFVETLAMRRESEEKLTVRPLKDPYPVKFTKADRKEKIVLIPNTSRAFCRLMSAAMGRDGLRTEPLDMGRDEAIRLGKQYVHNDICFPAQMVIGEALAALRSGKYDGKDVAIGMGKYVGDCRLTHYSALLRKALDDAGYPNVPVVTNDDQDSHDMHPGYHMSVAASVNIAMGLPMIDALEELLRKIRPYELEPGSADRAFEAGIDAVMEGLERHGSIGARKGFQKAIQLMKEVPYDRSHPKPAVLIVGEYLLNFHPGANRDIEAYLERNGMEVIEARMTDVIRKTYFYKDSQVKEYHVHKPVREKVWYRVADEAFEVAHSVTDSIAKEHPLYSPAVRMPELVQASDPIIHHTFDAGEGVLIPGEILHHAAHGCRAFIILQPFGCLPNHVVGRGISKQLKALYPDAQILPLDYDPDVSFANIENRLQMLIINEKQRSQNAPHDSDGTGGGAAPSAPQTRDVQSAPKSKKAKKARKSSKPQPAAATAHHKKRAARSAT